jgi:hypothetical protein
MDCPCCDRWTKQYERKINSSMARSLIYIFNATRDMPPDGGWIKPSLILPHTMSSWVAGLRHWGLLEAKAPVGKSRRNPEDGYWRMTELGRGFVLRTASVPQYAITGVGGDLICLEGHPVTIDDALGTRFVYDEVMAACELPRKAA